MNVDGSAFTRGPISGFNSNAVAPPILASPKIKVNLLGHFFPEGTELFISTKNKNHNHLIFL